LQLQGTRITAPSYALLDLDYTLVHGSVAGTFPLQSGETTDVPAFVYNIDVVILSCLTVDRGVVYIAFRIVR
jgi:hypothetical protein